MEKIIDRLRTSFGIFYFFEMMYFAIWIRSFEFLVFSIFSDYYLSFILFENIAFDPFLKSNALCNHNTTEDKAYLELMYWRGYFFKMESQPPS